MRRILLSLAADVLEISADDLTMRDGRIRSSDGALDVDVTEVTGKLGNATIDGTGTRGPNPDGFRVNTFGCQIAQVAVDPGIGVVTRGTRSSRCTTSAGSSTRWPRRASSRAA